MRKGWKEIALGEIVELGKSGSWGQDDQSVDLIQAVCLRGTDLADLIDRKIPNPPLRWIREAELRKSKCSKDMVLIETSGSKCGRSIVLTDEILDKFDLPVIYSNFCRTLTIDTKTVTHEFIEIWFLYNYANGIIPSYRATSAMPNLDVKALLRIEKIKVPPIAEQKRIVDLIFSIDYFIEALQRQLENAKKSRNAVMHVLLNEDGGHWEETTLGDIANWSGGITPSMANVEFWEGGNIPWISSGDISTYESEGTKKNVTQKALAETSLKLLPAGTVIVVVRSGILLHSLPVAILRAPATINQDIKAAQSKEIVKPEYLWFLLRYLETEILSTCRKTGTTVQSISTEALLGTKIKLPPISEQESIIEVISALDLVTRQIEKLIIDAENLRSGLLSDLLSGEHQIPAGYDTVIGAAT